MKVIYARERLKPSIFLAGPTPRDQETKSWRPKALKLLKKYEFEGTIYVPEDRGLIAQSNYDAQIQWEWMALEASTVIAFWIPRDEKGCPL